MEIYHIILIILIIGSIDSSNVHENEPTIESAIKAATPTDEDKSIEVELPPGPDNKSVLGCSAEICFGVCLLQGKYGGCRRDKCKCKGKFP